MTERRWIRNSQMLALLLKDFAHAHIWIYRRTNGRLGARLLWFPAALVTTTGRRTGEPLVTPTLYLRDGAWCCPHRSVDARTVRRGIAT